MEGKSSGPSCSGLNLVAHPRAKSKVWKYFGFDTDADGCILHWKRIYCRVCMSQIAYSGNTSNLSYHLEKNHPVEFSEFLKSNTDQMREAFTTVFSRIKSEPSGPHVQQQPHEVSLRQNVDFENRRHNDLTAAVISFVCQGLYPISVVEEPTFKNLMSTVGPGYSPPSKRDLAGKMVPDLYCRTRDSVFRDLAAVVNCGVTTDLWQSQTQNRTYISLSLHSVNYNSLAGFTMIDKCLKTFEVQEDNTAENITRAMYEAFVEWGITHKVSGATTNGSVDIVKACSLLELSVEMPCFGHTIKRAVDEAFQLPRLDSFLGRCRRLVDHFGEPGMFILKEKQKQHGLSPCSLITDRGRLWLSTLAMLQRLKEQRVAITATLLDVPSSHLFSLDDAEWSLMEGLIGLLQPFKVIANMITSCRYPTISLVRPVLHMLLNTTLKAIEGDLKEISMAKDVISKVLSSSYLQNSESQEISMFLNIASFLDPRYKKLPFLSVQERSEVESNLIEEAKVILEKQMSERSCLNEFSFVNDEPPTKKSAPLRESLTITSTQENPLAAIFCQSNADQSHEELHAQVVEELSNYKSQRVLGLNEDPLLWWTSHALLFPTLPKVLQKYWCVPATSVPCHRLFSSSGAVLCGKRNRIAPALVDQQVFLYENLRSYHEPEPCYDDLDCDVLPKQNGRVAIVTGGTRGMGFETARHLASLGMHVIIVGNEREEGKAAARKIQEECSEGKAEFVFVDLTSLKSVRQFAQTFKDRGLPLHVLVNNAGTMLVPERQTEDGFEFHFCLNYLSHFLLTNLLLDVLKRSGRPGCCSRVVNMSSATHYAGVMHMDDLNRRVCYSSHGAYAQSKLALVLFTNYLQEQLTAGGFHVTVNAVDPGMVDTALYDNLWTLAQMLKRPVAKVLFRTPAEGASISIYAAGASDMEGVGGCYLYNGRKTQSSELSYDSELQAELWKKSCQLVGLQQD